MGAHIVGGSLRYTTIRITNFQAFFAGLGTELFPFKNGCCYILRWYFNCIYFGGGHLAFRQFFSLLKTLVFMVKRYSILFFLSNCLATHFFYSVHTISHV